MGSNVSSVAGILAPGQAAGAAAGPKEEGVNIQFADFMSRMTSQLGESFHCGSESAYSGKAEGKSELTAGADSYDKYQYRENHIQKQSETSDAAEDGRIKDRLDSYEEKVKDVLKEELGVTEEQIQEAMEQLGMTVLDLMNPNQLANLVSMLTGCEDAGQLLCNSAFLNVLKEAGVLTEGLLRELGLTEEELRQMFQMQNEQADNLSVLDEAPVETVPEAEAGSQNIPENAAAFDSQTEYAVRADQVVKETVSAGKEEDAKEPDAKAEQEALEEPLKEEGFTAKKTGDFSQQTDSGLHQQNHTGEAAGVPAHQRQEAVIQSSEAVPEFARQFDVEHIIKQIVEYTKISLNHTQTTLEMQLNPEHLGKIYLEVTAKQGNVSAHIIAQNELVKEALETQLVELKQNLNQAGVKVDAVEVTVGSHEFEKNLEQNGKQEERQAEEREKASGKLRRLHVDELGELAGLMTEEEALVAQMMADRGNSIDYTA